MVHRAVLENGMDSPADKITSVQGHWECISAVHIPVLVSHKVYRSMQGSQIEGERPDASTPGTRTWILLGAGAVAPGGGGCAGWPPVFTATPGTFTLTLVLACCRLRPLVPNHTQQLMSGTAQDADKALRTLL